jgi:hypothetical protein
LARAHWRLGKIATALTDYERARQHFYAALILIKGKHTISFDTLNLILGIASLFASEGNLERSLQLTMMVHQQTGISQITKTEAEDLLGKLKSELAPEITANIEDVAKTLSIERVMQSLIMELET